MAMNSSHILHVDMDAFYAAVEVRDCPDLRGKPVVVGGLQGRGVVCSASYEARAFGVRAAMPMSTALRLCPTAVVLAGRMAVYVRESQHIMAILERFTPVVEPLSLDEAFLDVHGTERLFGPACDVAVQIRAAILAEMRLTASVGIAANKFLAKLASDLAKPDGICEIGEREKVARLAPLPVRMVFGVGRRTEQLLSAAGIRTIGDVQRASESALRQAVGSFATHLRALAHGEDARAVEAHRERHSHGAECTFAADTTDWNLLEETLLGFAHEIAFDLRQRGLRVRTVSIKVRRHDFHTVTRSHTLREATCLAADLYRVAVALLHKLNPRYAVRLIGLSAENLLPGHERQRLLFGDQGKRERVERGLDRIRTRFGDEAIQPARLLHPEDDAKPRAP